MKPGEPPSSSSAWSHRSSGGGKARSSTAWSGAIPIVSLVSASARANPPSSGFLLIEYAR
jgi:hypothetical protein